MDESGQISLAKLVAIGIAAKNIVLVGDQMQLGLPPTAQRIINSPVRNSVLHPTDEFRASP